MKKILIIAFAIIGLAAVGCKQGPIDADIPADPVAEDFTISGLAALYDGAPKRVTITANEGSSSGHISIWYEGLPPSDYARTTAAPSAAGSYAVTFDVAASPGFNAVSSLSAGTLIISAIQLDPVADDYTIDGLNVFFDNSPKALTITPKAGSSTGAITIHYEGINSTVHARSTDAPSAIGSYTVTFDVAAAGGFNAAVGLFAGTLIISPAPIPDLNIHFLELGNEYTGDSIYIQYGDIDILIDAGSRENSATTIAQYIQERSRDNILEYVIVTHGHQDHIAGFVSTGTTTGIFEAFEIGTIIEFSRTNSTTLIYSGYQSARNAAIARGAVRYTALQCYNETDGAQRIYDLCDSEDGAKLEILYHRFYETNSNNENEYSIAARIILGDMHFLFTGDLESDGESSLVDYYEENYKGLGHHVLYKAGHHGSNTSSTNKLLNAITPEYVVITAIAGTTEYAGDGFPVQQVINRIAPHTDHVYITTLEDRNSSAGSRRDRVMSFNGNITFTVSDGEVSLSFSNNNLKLKESAWFLQFRTMPAAWR